MPSPVSPLHHPRSDDPRRRSNAGRGYLYLLQEREFFKSDENVFKVGRTDRDVWDRFKEYPKGSRMLSCKHVPLKDVARLEALVKTRLRELFRSRVDIGSESFAGPWQEMDDVIDEVVREDRRGECDRNDVQRRTGLSEREYDDRVLGFVRENEPALRGRRVAFEDLEAMFRGHGGARGCDVLLKEPLARACREVGAIAHESLSVQFPAKGESSILDAAMRLRAFACRHPPNERRLI